MSHHKIPKRKIVLLFSLLTALVIITSIFIWGVLSGWIRPFAAGAPIVNKASFSYTNSSGQQVLGESNTVTIQVTTAPTPPSNLAVTANSSTQITLTWTDNSNDETGFKIERSLSSTSGFAQIGTTAANVATYIDTGLKSNTTYYYQVRASNATGDSTYSNIASATTPDTIPAAPTNLVTTSTVNRQIDLAWQDNSSNETGFKVERSLSTSGFTQIGTTGVNVNTYNDPGLTAGTTYYYQVRATNSAGDSGYSNVASGIPISVPNAPSNLAASPDSTLTIIHLTWVDNSTNESGFILQRMPEGSATWTTISSTLPPNTTKYDDNSVQLNITYSYRVSAFNSVGSSAYSNVASAKIVRDTQAPTAPTNLTGASASYSQVNLSWTASTDNVGVTGYYIYRNGVKVGSTTGATTYSDKNLSASTTYTYYVTAFDAAGNESAASNTISVTTPAPPDNPPTVTLTAPADGTTVSGTAVAVTANATDDKGVSRVDFYIDGIVVFPDTASPYSWSWDTTSYNNGGHTVMARAYDTVGQYISDTHTVTVNNPTQTLIISKVNVSTTGTSATVKWVTNLPATSQVCYGISRPDEICTPVDQNLVTSHQMTILGLTSRTNYLYEIRSNLGGTGAGSARYTKSFRTKTK